MKTPFLIDHIDPLGQGVSRTGEKITFIAKTLPEESGQATITREAKGVRFGRIESPGQLDHKSPLRIEASCPHFDICNGCHYLHTSYENELKFKTDALYRHLGGISRNIKDEVDIKVFDAPERDSYRNRLQLHYDKKKKQLGFINSATKSIVSIPNCKIANPKIQKELHALYEDNNWLKLVSKQRGRGHIELYLKNDSVQTSINRPYAEGGFSQVYPEMNEKMVNHLEELLNIYRKDMLLIDLFGGSGNLSKNQTERETLVVDYGKRDQAQFPNHQRYQELDLYAESAINSLEKQISNSENQLILDPPRKGYPAIGAFVGKFAPDDIFYVSCQATTMVRDIKMVMEKYEIVEIALFDFFPSTHHFESFCHLQKKTN